MYGNHPLGHQYQLPQGYAQPQGAMHQGPAQPAIQPWVPAPHTCNALTHACTGTPSPSFSFKSINSVGVPVSLKANSNQVALALQSGQSVPLEDGSHLRPEDVPAALNAMVAHDDPAVHRKGVELSQIARTAHANALPGNQFSTFSTSAEGRALNDTANKLKEKQQLAQGKAKSWNIFKKLGAALAGALGAGGVFTGAVGLALLQAIPFVGQVVLAAVVCMAVVYLIGRLVESYHEDKAAKYERQLEALRAEIAIRQYQAAQRGNPGQGPGMVQPNVPVGLPVPPGVVQPGQPVQQGYPIGQGQPVQQGYPAQLGQPVQQGNPAQPGQPFQQGYQPQPGQPLQQGLPVGQGHQPHGNIVMPSVQQQQEALQLRAFLNGEIDKLTVRVMTVSQSLEGLDDRPPFGGNNVAQAAWELDNELSQWKTFPTPITREQVAALSRKVYDLEIRFAQLQGQ